MIDRFRDMSPAEKSLQLIGLEVIVGLQPLFLDGLGMRSLALGLLFHAITWRFAWLALGLGASAPSG